MSLHGITRAESARRARSREGGAIRRAREKAARTNEKPLTLDEVFARSNGYCSRCKLPVRRADASIEHVVPLSKGGADGPSNQALAHRKCNSAKGVRLGERKKGLRCRNPLRRKPRELPEDVF